jgi:hypothetical protein
MCSQSLRVCVFFGGSYRWQVLVGQFWQPHFCAMVTLLAYAIDNAGGGGIGTSSQGNWYESDFARAYETQQWISQSVASVRAPRLVWGRYCFAQASTFLFGLAASGGVGLRTTLRCWH